MSTTESPSDRPATPYGDPDTRTRILDAAWELVEEGSDVAMGAVARRAGVSRQAVYLHVGDRAGLLTALVDHMDRRLGMEERMREVLRAPSAAESIEALVAMLAMLHPAIAGVARVLEAARRSDPDANAAWEDRMGQRRAGSRLLVQRLADEGRLSPGWDVETAAGFLFATTVPSVWESLVVEQGWTGEQYRDRLTAALRAALVSDGSGASAGSAPSGASGDRLPSG